MATTRTVTVKPTGGDYASLNAALAGESADLVALQRKVTITPYAMEDTTAASTGSGYVTDADCTLNIVVPQSERHAGVWSDSKYRLVVTATSNPYNALSVLVDNATVDGVQIKVTATDLGNVRGISVGGGGKHYVWNALLCGVLAGTCSYGAGLLADTWSGGVQARVYVYNSVAYGWGAGSQGGFSTAGLDSIGYFNNCTSYGNAYGYCIVANSQSVLMNCLGSDNSNNFYSIYGWSTSDYNASSGSGATGGAHDRINQTFTFVDEAGKNFRLVTGGSGIAGTLDTQYTAGGGDTQAATYLGAVATAGVLAREARKVVTGAATSTATLSKRVGKALAGAGASSGVIIKRASKLVAGGSPSAGSVVGTKTKLATHAGGSTPSGAIAKQTRATKTGVVTPVGAVVRRTSKAITGAAVTPAAMVVTTKTKLLSLAGGATPLGVLFRRIPQALVGTAPSSGALVKRTSKRVTGAIQPAAALVKRVSRAILGVITPSGAATVEQGKAWSGGGATTPSGALGRQTRKALTGALTLAGALTKRAFKVVAGGLTPSGAASNIKTRLWAGAGSMTLSGALARKTLTVLAGTVTTAGVAVKRSYRVVAGAVAPSGARTGGKSATWTGAGASTPSGTLSKGTGKAFGGGETPTAILAKRVARTVTGAASSAGLVARVKSAVKTLAGATAPTGTATGRMTKALGAVLAPAGSLWKRISTILTGEIAPTGEGYGVVPNATVPGARTSMLLRRAQSAYASRREVFMVPGMRRTVLACAVEGEGNMIIEPDVLDPKDPAERQTYAIDMATEMARTGDPGIEAVAWDPASTPAGLTVAGTSISGTKAVVWLTGGVAGVDYKVACTITMLAQGGDPKRVYRRSIIVPCRAL